MMDLFDVSRLMVFMFVSHFSTTLPETNSEFAPKNGWLVGIRSGFLVGFRPIWIRDAPVTFS